MKKERTRERERERERDENMGEKDLCRFTGENERIYLLFVNQRIKEGMHHHPKRT